MRSLLAYILLILVVSTRAQGTAAAATGQFMISEDVGLPMSKAQIIVAAQDAWAASFGQEPASQLTLVDADNGLMEGTARMNYRSTMLMGREETMGTVTYQVTIQAKNGQCHLRVHNLRHAGNRTAKGGGIHMGVIMEGVAPEFHYEGVGIGPSRRMHTDVRNAAANRLGETSRRFAARLRSLGGQ